MEDCKWEEIRYLSRSSKTYPVGTFCNEKVKWQSYSMPDPSEKHNSHHVSLCGDIAGKTTELACNAVLFLFSLAVLIAFTGAVFLLFIASGFGVVLATVVLLLIVILSVTSAYSIPKS